ncbi:MAG: type VI secretion system contractile sheath protein TssC [Chitinophagales bacterium]|nr:type VI secretion system contractile sheath protein TssC [Chitinophagales bacterium]
MEREQQAAEKQYKENLGVVEGVSLQDTANQLVKYGGFKVFGNTIKGTDNLNPELKARKKIFLTDDSKKQERENLKKTLSLWYELLSESENPAEMIEKAQAKADSAARNLNKNLKTAVEASKELEANYRSLHLFYKNCESDNLKNVTIFNAELDQLKDLDNPLFFDAIAEEIKHNYDRLDLKNNYSMLVVPGYLGNNQVIDKWAKMAHQNKVMLVSDFENLETPDAVADFFETAQLTGGEAHKSNVMLTANWLVGRGKDTEIGEEEDVYVAPSSALAGNIYRTLMSQVAAGKKFGGLNEVGGTRFTLKKSEISNLEKMGLVPMVNEYGKVMAMSAKTLFNGDNLGLQTYSVVRVFDHIMKTLMDFLNRRAFENFDVNTEMELREQIVKYLNKISGPGKLIEKFKILRFEQDPDQKDRIFLDIFMTPYFPAKSYVVSLDGQKGEDADSAEWKGDIKQQ